MSAVTDVTFQEARLAGPRLGWPRASSLLPMLAAAAVVGSMATVGAINRHAAPAVVLPTDQSAFGDLSRVPFGGDVGRDALSVALAATAVDHVAFGPMPVGAFTAATKSSLAEALAGETSAPSPTIVYGAVPSFTPAPPKRDVAAAPEAIPLPPARPAGLAVAHVAPDAKAASMPQGDKIALAPPDNRTFFEKLFGSPASPAAPTKGASLAPSIVAAPVKTPAPAPVVAFAPPPARWSPSVSTTTTSVPGSDGTTAVYNIASHVVTMPDGTTIEAHSGYGDKLDDPRYVSVRMRGATPPAVYALEPREGSFHGVDALRLTPVGDNQLFGRAGLLAHPYMLGPNGDSNGCVSLKDYDAFLKAYRDGRVKKLVVVAGI
jgi:Protein of unknown function (DUF2778)